MFSHRRSSSAGYRCFSESSPEWPCLRSGAHLKPTTKKIAVANGKRSIWRGLVENVRVFLVGVRVSMDLLVVDGMPFDVSIGALALESLHAQLDLGRQTVKIRVGDLSAELSLNYGISKSKVTRSSTDSEEFKPDSGIITETSDPDEDVFVVAVVNDVPSEPGLSTATPNFDNYQIPHLIE